MANKREFHGFYLDRTDSIRSSCASLPQSAGNSLPGSCGAPGSVDLESDAAMKTQHQQQDHMRSTRVDGYIKTLSKSCPPPAARPVLTFG